MISLDGAWSLAWADDYPEFLTGPDAPMRHALPAQVPEPVHATLQRHGLLDDPRVGLNSLRARWVEEQFWVYRRRFRVPEADAGKTAFLTFAHLEQDAVVFLNGVEVGRHANAHRPARFDVGAHLRTGDAENVLVVRVDAGLYGVADRPGADYQPQLSVLLNKRHWQRKGQWQCGWDWQQRMMNVGILGSVALVVCDGPTVFDASVRATLSEDHARAEVRGELEIHHPGDTPIEAVLSCVADGVAAEATVTLSPGWSRHAVTAIVPEPRLWWPVGHGEQHLTPVALGLTVGGRTQTRELRTGIRRVEIDQSPHPEEGRHFIVTVNGRRIFCKGGNWVPPDMMPSTVTRDTLERITDAAVDAHFNLLRIWGGGVWAGHDLLELCDQKGLLVWHDLLFACAKYPGDDPAFAKEVRAEVTWGMRAFAHHPSVVVWCGNNEIEWGDWAWGYDDKGRTHPHYALFHHDFPKIAREEAPHVAYWISSPYSPDYAHPNDPTVGDQHPWTVSLQVAGGADWWDYRTFVDRFPNEGGVLGASTLATLRAFLPDSERRLLSPSWEHHDNPYATNDLKPGTPGHAYQTVALWLGRDSQEMGWETHAVASGLLQGEGIGEYIANYRRRMFSSSAAIFWMFNDSWPVTHGWTIVDHPLRRKLSFHPVRRAFQPVAVFVARDGDSAVVVGVNETQDSWTGTVVCGLFDPSASGLSDAATPATLAPNAATELARFPWPDALPSAYAVLRAPDGAVVSQHRLHTRRFHELGLAPDPSIAITREADRIVLRSDDYVWGVCLEVEGETAVPDNAFDLLPGVPWTVPWSDALGEPTVVTTGNALVHGATVGETTA